MKREYSKPAMEVEVFEASEYVAACYILNCNVPAGFGFIDNNGNKKYDDGDTYIAAGTGCGTKHIGVNEPQGPHMNSMWQPTYTDWWGNPDVDRPKGKAFDTYHWEQASKGHLSDHFTRDVKWESNPNAS